MSSVRGNKNRPFLNGRNNTVPMVSTGSSSRSAGSIPDSRHQNDIDSSFSDLLERITKGGNSGDSLLDLLNSLGIDQDKGLTGGQRDDWNKQLLDTLINYALEKDKRGYNEQLRDEQRLYDTPTNQLARLMGAGISRDAALQLLGQGNEPIQTEGAQAAEGVAPSESRTNEMQANLAPLNATLNVIGTVSSLVGLGFSIPQAIQQTKLLKNTNLLNSSQLAGYSSASQAFDILNSAGAADAAFGSVSSAVRAIQDLANNGNSDAVAFVNNGGLSQLSNNSYFASQSLHNLYKSERASNDYDKSFGLFVDKTEAETDFLKADKDKVVQSILNLQAELIKTQNDAEFVKLQSGLIEYSKQIMIEQANILKKQGRNIEADTLLKKSQALNLDSQTTGQNLQNDFTTSLYNYELEGQSVRDILLHKDAVNAYNDMKKFVSVKDKALWEKELKALSMDYQRLYNVCLLQDSYTRGAFHKYQSDPEFKDFMITCSAMTQSGAWNYIQAELNASRQGSKYLFTGVGGIQMPGVNLP